MEPGHTTSRSYSRWYGSPVAGWIVTVLVAWLICVTAPVRTVHLRSTLRSGTTT